MDGLSMTPQHDPPPRQRGVHPRPHPASNDGARGDLGDRGRNRGQPQSVLTVESEFQLSETEFKSQFEAFIRNFRIHRMADEGWDDDLWETPVDDVSATTGMAYYMQQLHRVVEGPASSNAAAGGDPPPPTMTTAVGLHNFTISLIHLKDSNPALLRNTLHYPADSIVYMDEVLSDIANTEYQELGLPKITIKTSLIRHPKVTCMRDLDPAHIETLIALRGIVIRCSSVIPDMRAAAFRCTSRNVPNQPPGTVCGYEETVHLANGEVQEPLRCIRCNAKYSFELYHARCLFGNKQLLKIQETPESIPEGEAPHTVLAYVYDELVDAVKPGDFMELTGIYRAAGVRVAPRTRSLKSIYRTFIDTNSIHKDHLNRYLIADAELNGPSADADMEELEHDLREGRASQQHATAMSPEMIERMKALGRDPEIYEKLVQSLAPNIWECDDTKKGLLCQLFGGTPKVIGGRTSRSDIHVLLCGDPSTAKSQLLQYVHGLAPRGVYTCGRGSSAVGLTASVTRDVETREFVLESGAIVLSDRGICCIDEFDKMDETARIILHEVMEQQTVSIAKAGIVCSLNARTAILASANPINSRYDTRKSVVENINLPPSLMSRFDLVYLMLDTPNSMLDRALAEHLCQLYTIDANQRKKPPPIDRRTMAHYISYAREHCKPKLSAEAGALLVEIYTELRQRGSDSSGKSLSATPRQLESLVRLSEALAKMELAEYVVPKHVKEAVRLIQVATYAALIDPTTGRLDFDQLNAGLSGESRARRQLLERTIMECIQSTTGGLERNQLATMVTEKLRAANQYGLDPTGREFNMLLRELEEFGSIGRVHGGKIVSLVVT